MTLKTDYDGLNAFHKVYVAKVFTDTPVPENGMLGDLLNAPNVIKDDKPSTTTRLFVNVQPVTPKHRGEFVAIDAAISNPTYRQQILRNALLELRSFQNKYRSYEELTGVSKAIDAFADTLK